MNPHLSLNEYLSIRNPEYLDITPVLTWSNYIQEFSSGITQNMDNNAVVTIALSPKC